MKRCLPCLLSMFFFVAQGYAEGSKSYTISGQLVADEGGEIVSLGTVSTTNDATGQTIHCKVNKAGRFTVFVNETGNYRLDVSAVGFMGAKVGVQITDDKPAHELGKIGMKTLKMTTNGKTLDQLPEFPGGVAALVDFVAKNTKYPQEAVESRTEGKVICSFVVDKEGNVTDVKIEQGLIPAMDQEAMRVAGSMPRWKPGKDKGKNVAVKCLLPVIFRFSVPE